MDGRSIYNKASYGIALTIEGMQSTEYIPTPVKHRYILSTGDRKNLAPLKIKIKASSMDFGDQKRKRLSKKLVTFPNKIDRLETNSKHIRYSRNKEFISEVANEMSKTMNDSW